MNSKKNSPNKLSVRYTELITYGVLFLGLVAAVFVININLANRSRSETEQVFCATKQQEYWQTSYRNLLKTQTGLIELDGLLEGIALSSPELAEKLKHVQSAQSVDAFLTQVPGQDTLTKKQLATISHKVGEISEAFASYKTAIGTFDSTVAVLRGGGSLSIDGRRYEIEKVTEEKASRYIEAIEKTWLSSRSEIFKTISRTDNNHLFPDESTLTQAIDFAITKDEFVQANNRGFIVSLGEIATERVNNLLFVQIGALALSFIVFIAMALRLTVSLRRQEKLIKDSQSQLVQSEKMASLGQMMAGLAHEMNTPLGFVRSNVEIIEENERELHSALTKSHTVLKLLVKGDYDRIETETQKALSKITEIDKLGIVDENKLMVTNSLEGLDRIQKLIVNLRNFSRLDQTIQQLANINECLESTLVIANHLIKRHMTVKKEYSNLPPIMCAPAQLNQVFLNIISNAAHATEERGHGTLLLKTWTEKGEIVIQISDDGKGIPAEQLNKIFDPFFTTKPVGQGTGLGLSISQKIIEDGHNGSIEAKSTVDKGTDFFIRLPIKSDQKQQTEQAIQTTDILN
jgi:two-component system, NtrC family, sensor kinase